MSASMNPSRDSVKDHLLICNLTSPTCPLGLEQGSHLYKSHDHPVSVCILGRERLS